ncbi:MAG: EamA family transporter [Candidatus Nitrosocosmicus sp.]
MADLKVWLVLIMLWVVIGSTYIGIKISIDTIPPFLMSGTRYALSGGLLLLLYFLIPSKNYLTEGKLTRDCKIGIRSRIVQLFGKKQWREASIIGAALILGGQGLLTWGEQFLSSNFTALLFSTIPIWILLLGKFLYKEKLKKFTILGVVLGSIGFIILISPTLLAQFVEINSSNTKFEFVGILALMVATLSWSGGSLYSSKADLPDNIFISTGMMLFVGGLLLLVLSVTTGELQKFHGDTISRNSFISLIYLITVGSAGWVGFFWILRYTSATLANTFAYVSPVIAIILGWVILDEVITIQLVVATMIIMIGVVLIANRGKF